MTSTRASAVPRSRINRGGCDVAGAPPPLASCSRPGEKAGACSARFGALFPRGCGPLPALLAALFFALGLQGRTDALFLLPGQTRPPRPHIDGIDAEILGLRRPVV